MDPKIKPDPDGPRKTTYLGSLLDSEAKVPWKGGPFLSSQLRDAIHRELNAAPVVKFIEDVAPLKDFITLKCSLNLVSGVNSELDAARIALFKLINATSVQTEFWDSKTHYALIGADAIPRVARFGITTGQLVNYLRERARSTNSDPESAFQKLHEWSRQSQTEPGRASAPVMQSESSSTRLNSPSQRPALMPSAHSEPPGPQASSAFELSSRLDEEPVSDSPSPSAVSDMSEHESTVPKSESPSSEGDIVQEQHSNFQLQRLLSDQPLEVLEKGVKAGVSLLDQLKDVFKPNSSESQEANMWLERIEKIQKQAIKTRTVVGVVGNTGAGKSSVINAMLDEERLVPTNCMRACTAVITEISYNDQLTPYRATIEFIDRADWAKELKILFDELFDSNGKVSRDCTDEDSEAGVAYAKIKAVYPKMTKEMIEESSVDELLRHDNARVLGKTWNLSERSNLVFYKKLQGIIDSKEKNDKAESADGKKKKPKEPAYWPLIKTVKLYVKSPALETGAVIVDLPGVHDSNAARAKVADNYMKQCTGLWIVAPINRAVDDKAAKTLLGETFKRQLKMDGGFSTVSFICSKTDDISVMEATDSLGLEDEFERYEDQLNEHETEIRQLKQQVKDLTSEKQDIADQVEAALEEVDVWEELKDDIEDGKTVFRPTSAGAKRKRGQSKKSRKTKRRRVDLDSESEGSSYAESEATSNASDEENDQGQLPLTMEEVVKEIDRLKAIRRESRDKKAAIDGKVKPLKEKIGDLEERLQVIDTEKRSRCISGRNQYSQQAIRTDYASGIRELDEEIAQEEDEANFNPDEERRDYDEVARNLPVFCVSSRAYHKLMGRFRQESDVPGFKTTEETQIPQLQQHCRELTIKGRTNACNHFFGTLSQLLNSLSIWASNDGTGSNLSADHRSREEKHLQQKISGLESNFDKLADGMGKELRTEIAEQVYDRFDPAIQAAKQAAIPTVRKWGAPIDRDNPTAGGVHWGTYAAICRRNGIYTNARGSFDWNGELVEPVIKQIVPGWERAFVRRVPGVMKGFVKDACNLIRDFHVAVSSRARMTGTAGAGMYLLEEQIKVWEQELKRICDATVESINDRQKEVNREFRPVVEDEMSPVYERCKQDRGTGVTKRRKGYMEEHINEHKENMFKDSTAYVKDALDVLIRESRCAIEDQIDEHILGSLKRDYMSAFGWSGDAKLLPKSERVMRKDIQEKVLSAEVVYNRVIDPDDPMEDAVVDDEAITEDKEGGSRQEKKAQTVRAESAEIPASTEDSSTKKKDQAASGSTSPSPKQKRPPTPPTSHKPIRDSGIGIHVDNPDRTPSESPPPQKEPRVLERKHSSEVNKQSVPAIYGTNERELDEKRPHAYVESASRSASPEPLPDLDTLLKG